MEDNAKIILMVLQIVVPFVSIGIVQMAYTAKGYPLTVGIKLAQIGGFLLLLFTGHFFFGFVGQFCGMVLFLIIGLLHVAALPSKNNQQIQQPALPQQSYLAQGQTLGIDFFCTACNQELSADTSVAGTVIQCPLCKSNQIVPRS